MESFKPKPAADEEPSALLNYWRRFGFPGKPPKPGSVAEKRLLEKCQAYTDLVLSGGSSSVDVGRRQLHNEIAVMIFGRPRTDMSYDLAEKISEFASLATTGQTLEQAMADLEKFRDERNLE